MTQEVRPAEPDPDPATSKAASGAAKRPSKLREIAIQVAIVVVGYLVISSWRDSSLLDSGGAAPAFALTDTGGGQVSLEQFRGKRVLLHFWATWCGVCKAEIPTLKKLSASLADDEALLTIVDPSTDPDSVRQFTREHGVDYTVLIGTPEVRSRYAVTSFPTNYYVTSAGKIHGGNAGVSSQLGMRARLGCAR